MCSILGIFDLKTPADTLRPQALQMSKKQRHRGPDWSGIFACDRALLLHERLAIVDPASGRQPLYGDNGNLVLAVNGEIYNHRELREGLAKPYPFLTESDCEVILPLYLERGAQFLDELNGMFAFALYDKARDEYLIARDHIGIVPLYMGWDSCGNFYVASELKALSANCGRIEEFPPGHYLTSASRKPQLWYRKEWAHYEVVKEASSSVEELRLALEAAVHRQLMSDVPYGVLLSGGLDSSIISAIAKKYAARRIESNDLKEAWWPQLHSFAIGLKDSTDLVAARKVAEHIGTVHHEVHFTIEEGLDALRDVIYHLETYDVTTVRASTPMYLLARVIKSMGIKMVLTGEGSDELFGGYLYFHKAPNAQAFHEETVRKLDKLHLYDCLRANKSLAAWGVEGRVPFLDKEFIEVAMRLSPKEKMVAKGRIEKWLLRKAFEGYLPTEVAWRQKEQFSDGVGYSWIDNLKKMTAEAVSNQQMEEANSRFPINPPRSKEEYYYRSIFEEHFPGEAAARCVPSEPSVACSTAIALEWDKAFQQLQDPSGRAVTTVHQQSY